MKKSLVLAFIGSMTIIVGLCLYLSRPTRNQAMITETYHVDDSTLIAKHISNLYGQNWIGNAHPLGPKTLVVNMPKEYKLGVRSVVNNAKKLKKEKMVEIDFWIVRGTNLEIKSETNDPYYDRIAALLKKNVGSQNFQILEHYKGKSLTDSPLKMEGWLANLSTLPRTNITGDGIDLKMRVDSRLGEIDGNLELENKKLTLFSQNGVHINRLENIFRDKTFLSLDKENPQTMSENIFYLVQGTLL